jgi:branched-chain amino acid transport system substrate-binding protein
MKPTNSTAPQSQTPDLNRRATVAGVGAAIASAGLPITAAAQSKDVKVGFLLPLTGAFAEAGQLIKSAIDMAVEEINQAGGIKSIGGKLIAVYGNSSSPDEANTETNRMISSEKVSAIVGAYSSGATISSTVIAERASIPYLVPNALADEITERGLKFVFKTVPHFSQYAINGAQMVKELSAKANRPVKTVSLVRENNFFGNVVGKAFAAHLGKADLQLLNDNIFPTNPTSFEDIIVALKSQNPDVVFAAGEPSSITLLFQQLKELKYWPKLGWVGCGGGYTNPTVVQNLGPLAEGMMVINDWFPDINRPGSKELNDKFKKRTGGKDLLGNANTTYAAVYILADALQRAGSPDGTKIRDALAATRITSGPATFMYERVNFDEKGMMPNSLLIGAQIQKGGARVVWPNSLKVADAVWPVPAPR